MKQYHSHKQSCIECLSPINNQVFQYSLSNYSLPLCIPCQNVFKVKAQKATAESISLYVALKYRGVPAELEKWDGHKTIDIAVTEAKVNIEVDGLQHNFDSKQALADLKRTFFAFKKGYLTLRIPNTLIRFHIEETTDFITEFLMESREQIGWN